MIDYLNVTRPDIVYTHMNKVGGMFTHYYCYEKDLKEEGRVPYHSNATWLKPYQGINHVPLLSRRSKDSFNFLVLSLTAKLNNGLIELYNGTTKLREKETIYYGQVFTPIKDIKAYKRHYIDVDLSLNSFKYLTSNNEFEPINLLNLKKGDNLENFVERNELNPTIQGSVTPLPLDIFKHYRGYNDSIPNRFLDTSISCLRTIKETDYINLSSTCYRWEEIVDSVAPESSQNLERSMLLDFKTEIDTTKLLEWVNLNFKDNFKDLAKSLGVINLIDFNFILHPPISTGMQFESSFSFITPRKGINSKIVDEIVIRIPKSIIRESQKALEIEITSGTNLYKYDSIKHPNLFSVYTNAGIEKPEMETDFKILIFEEVTKLSFPDKDFKVAFKIPNDLLSSINENKEYSAKVRLTDFTAERSI